MRHQPVVQVQVVREAVHQHHGWALSPILPHPYPVPAPRHELLCVLHHSPFLSRNPGGPRSIPRSIAITFRCVYTYLFRWIGHWVLLPLRQWILLRATGWYLGLGVGCQGDGPGGIAEQGLVSV